MKKGQNVKTAWVNSPQADDVADYYVSGHTISETAKRFNVSVYQVNNLAKKRGLTNGRTFREGSREGNKHKAELAESRLSDYLDRLGFKYIGGYTNRHGKVQVMCKTCGDKFERTVDFLRNGNVVCRKCEHEKALIRQADRREKMMAESAERKARREAIRLLRPPKDYYEGRHNDFLNRTGICEVCGKSYAVREYVESCGFKKAQDNGVCSDKCRRVKANRQGRESKKRRGVQDNHRHRAKKYGCEYDPSITLSNLINRDGLRCAICGEMCDPNDHSWSKFTGPMYPSIDHIVPMSKGGGHTWDNVQVAHIICNSYKGNNDEEL